ncbi:Rv3235 family protein [Kineococcus gynurae]|uniref:Rv3235 family protein n=1 Tax=Kineococcus gynurae TaxID=452979 RepID=A0ABV5LR89_9ACTN
MPRPPAAPVEAERRLRRYPVPPPGPPAVQDVSALLHAPVAGPGQEVLPFQVPGRSSRPALLPAGRRLPVGEPAPRPDATAFARRFLITLLEVLHGRRPAAQLLRWSSVEVQLQTKERTARLRHAGQQTLRRPPRIRTTRSCRLDDRTIEIALVVEVDDRVRAGALRLEARGDSWRVTACELG